MISQLQPESTIPSQIYELAVKHNVGTPLRRYRNKSTRVFVVVFALIFLALLGMLVYSIYGFIAFIFLSQTYPNINSVPDNQLDNYIWLQGIHDDFWRSSLGLLSPLLSFASFYLPLASANRTQLYICTDGLIKIYKKKEEVIRWDEIQVLSSPIAKTLWLVSNSGKVFTLPLLLISERNKTLMNIIIEEMKRRLLPEMLEQYERNETLTFGDLRVNQKGIYGTGNMVYWRQVGDINLEQNKLSLYYSTLPTNDEGNGKQLAAAKWHTWKEPAATSRPNLPLFVALVNAILDQRSASLEEYASLPQQRQELKERAELVWRKNKKRKRLTIASVIISSITVFALIIGLVIYQSVQEQQHVERATHALQKYFTQRAHKPYTVHVPGEHCGNGKEYWLDDDSKNSYICRSDGLLMTQNDKQHTDTEWLTFIPDKLSTQDAFTSYNYFPHNYHVQVNATFISGNADTCVSLAVHVQDLSGYQSFDVCKDGAWLYYHWDGQSKASSQMDSGKLPTVKKSYLLAIDVTDDIISLSVDTKPVISEHDNMYQTTNQLEIVVYGDNNAKEVSSALFSDFSYQPEP